MSLIAEKIDARGRVRTWLFMCDENGCVHTRGNLSEKGAGREAASHMDRHRLSCGHFASARCECCYGCKRNLVVSEHAEGCPEATAAHA
jgi:hypothetical protein